MVKSFHKLTIETSSEVVYKNLTNIERLKSWFMGELKGNSSEINGILESGDKQYHYTKMKVENLLKNKKILWKVIESYGQNEEDAKMWLNTEIEFDLEEKQLKRLNEKTATIVLFKHGEFSEKDSNSKVFGEINFYWAYFLMSLKNLCENGKGTPM